MLAPLPKRCGETVALTRMAIRNYREAMALASILPILISFLQSGSMEWHGLILAAAIGVIAIIGEA